MILCRVVLSSNFLAARITMYPLPTEVDHMLAAADVTLSREMMKSYWRKSLRKSQMLVIARTRIPTKLMRK